MEHRRFLFLYWVLLFVGVVSVYGQQGRVRVVVDDAVGSGPRRFLVLGFEDYLSLAPRFFADTSITEGSHVEMTLTLDAPRWLRIQGSNARADFMAEPGNTYRFKVYDDEILFPKNGMERENTGLANNDPNVLGDSVNVLVNTYLQRYNTLLYSGHMAKQTAAFCDSVEKLFVGVKQDLFLTLLHFRVDELRLLAGVWSEPAMFKLRLRDRPFRPENPDYAYAFGEFYKGRLGQVFLKNKMSHARELINGFRGADTLTKLLAVEPFYPKNEVGEGALLLGLTELLKNKEYATDGILYLFHEMADSSDSPTVRKLALSLYNKFHTPVPGDRAPVLPVADKAGTLTEVPSGFDKPVYVCFLDPKSEVTAAELGAMIEMKKKLKEKVALVPVIINATGAELARMQAAQRLTFDLYRNLSFSVLADFRLKSDCTCLVLTPDGKYLLPNAPLPSAPLAADQLLELAKTVR